MAGEDIKSIGEGDMIESKERICEWPRYRFPQACMGEEIVIGIDEAGRGPVLGPLVYCAAFWPVSAHEEICALGFDDSKQLKESDRDRMFKDIRNHPKIGNPFSVVRTYMRCP